MKYELDANKWLQNEIMKLTPGDYERTYYTIAELTNTVTDRSMCIVVPVDVYTHWNNDEAGVGFEIISIAAIASLCPWDMRHTHIHAESEYTSVDDVLMKLVEETPPMPQAAKHLDSLDQSRDAKLEGYKTLSRKTETVANEVSGCMTVNMADSLSSSLDDLKQRLDRVEKMVINPKINIDVDPRV